MAIELHPHFAEAVSSFSRVSQTGAHAMGKFFGHVAKELSTNLLAAIPTIAALNFGLFVVLDLTASKYESWFKERMKSAGPRVKVLNDFLVNGALFTSFTLFNVGIMSPFIHRIHPLISVAIAVVAVAFRALKNWYVNVYLASKVTENLPQGQETNPPQEVNPPGETNSPPMDRVDDTKGTETAAEGGGDAPPDLVPEEKKTT